MRLLTVRALSVTAAVLSLCACGKPAAKAEAPAGPAASPVAATPAAAAVDSARLCALIAASFKDLLPADPRRNDRVTNTCTLGGAAPGQPRQPQVRVSWSSAATANAAALDVFRNHDPKTRDAADLGAGAFSLLSSNDGPMAKLGFTAVKSGHLTIIEVEPGKPMGEADQVKATADAKALLAAL